jgi:hypothetical protein
VVQADARDMLEYMDSSYEFIIDKGTLDAICSCAGSTTSTAADLAKVRCFVATVKRVGKGLPAYSLSPVRL